MSLVPDYEVSSSEDSSESESDLKTKEIRNAGDLTTNKLPTPHFINPKKTENALTTSVFTNPFIEAENIEKAILEKHVKMVNTNDRGDFLNGRKICWNYRKGKCRFGHNCKYAHDSDLQKTKEQLDSENQIQETLVCQNQAQFSQPSHQELSEFNADTLSLSKRKRPGLTQGLIPGKKVMKNFFKQKRNSII